MRYYNGFTEIEMFNLNGMKKLGIEKVKPIFTRGVLVDMVAHLGRNMNLNEEIKPADLLAALQRQGIAEASFQPGDAIFFRTGLGRAALDQEQRRVQQGLPGHRARRGEVDRPEAVLRGRRRHLARRGRAGADPNRPFSCHQELITKNGIFLHENMDLSEVGKDQVYEFVYVMAPLRIKGATGSPGRPIAIT